MAKQRTSLSGRGKDVIGDTALADEADAAEPDATPAPRTVPAMHPRGADPTRTAGSDPSTELDAIDIPGDGAPLPAPTTSALRNEPDEAELIREMLANTSDYPPPEDLAVTDTVPPAAPADPAGAPQPVVPPTNPADPLADQILAAMPADAPPATPPADSLTAQILAAVPADAPPVSASPAGSQGDDDFVEPAMLRSPLPPFNGPPPDPAVVGLAPVAGEQPAPSPPGGPAPARIRLGGILLEAPLQGDVTPPGPASPDDTQAVVPLREMPADEAGKVLARITPEQQKALSRDIDRLYDKVTQDMSNDAVRGERALELLHQSRLILVEHPENYVDAEYQVERVRAMVIATQNSRQWAADYGRRLFTYETVWMVGLLLAYMPIAFWPITGAWLARAFSLDQAGLTAISQTSSFISTLIWGGLGGTIGALWSLWYHISERRDFDREYNMWYLTQPIMGIVLGGIVYLLFTTGLLVLQTDLSATDNLGARLLPALVAAIGGFRQNFVYEQMGRIVQIFSGQQNSASNTAPTDQTINIP